MTKSKLFLAIIVVIFAIFALIMQIGLQKSDSKNDVLFHYTHIDPDSQKLSAAKFLLANLPYHYSSRNIATVDPRLEEWRRETDLLLHNLQEKYGYDKIPRNLIDSIRTVRDSLLRESTPPEVTLTTAIQCDSSLITAAFLIRHIDNAFKAWRTGRFSKNLSFDDFKEYILPYTSLRHYGFITNGSHLNNLFSRPLSPDSAANLTEVINRYNHTIGVQRNLNGPTRRTRPSGLYDLYVHGIHECTDIAVWNCNILRSIGIPTVVENVVGYRDLTGRHYHCSVYDPDSNKWHPYNPESSLPGRFDFQNPVSLNIYRHLFSAQKNTPYFLKSSNEPIPSELSNPCIKDVTSHYVKVCKITIPLDTINTENHLAYLATFSANGGIKPTTWGVIDTKTKSITFENALAGVLYIPVYYTRNGYDSFFMPFYLTVDSGTPEINEIPYIDNDTALESLILTRKFPRKESMKRVSEGLVGGRFLASESHDFSKAEVLYTIEEAPLPQLKEYKFNKRGKFQYYRFQSPDNNPHANISHLEWIADNSRGYNNTAKATRVHCLAPSDTAKVQSNLTFVKLLDKDRNRMTWATEYDGNMQTAPGAYPNITLTLDEPQEVIAVRLAPLNADNGIKSGCRYELFYWSDGWQSCGIKTATYEYIEFENVPRGKLYWLKNHTEGKEEMPFIVVNGKQKFIYDEIINETE